MRAKQQLRRLNQIDGTLFGNEFSTKQNAKCAFGYPPLFPYLPSSIFYLLRLTSEPLVIDSVRRHMQFRLWHTVTSIKFAVCRSDAQELINSFEELSQHNSLHSLLPRSMLGWNAC